LCADSKKADSKQGFEPTHLHRHLTNMQNELFENNNSPAEDKSEQQMAG